MINGEREYVLRIHGPGIPILSDQSDRVGNHGNLQGMLRVVLLLKVSHERPAGDQLQTGQICEK